MKRLVGAALAPSNFARGTARRVCEPVINLFCMASIHMLKIMCNIRPSICSMTSTGVKQQSLCISRRSHNCLVACLSTRNFSSISKNDNDAELLDDLYKDGSKVPASSTGPLDVKLGSKKNVPLDIDIYEIAKAKNTVFQEHQIQESVRGKLRNYFRFY